MPTPNDTTSLAFAIETTQGAGPADAAAWAAAVGALATGFRVRHVMGSLDRGNFKRATVADERSQENVQDEELEIVDTIQGGIDFPFDHYLHSTGAVTADTTQVAHTALSTLLAHCLGGAVRTYSTTAESGTTTTAVLAADTGIELGCYVGVELAADPGRVHPRRVVAWNSGTDTVTFDQALPSAPQAGDIIHGAILLHFDEDALNDSSSPVSTLSALLSEGRGSGREHWEANGCKAWIDSITLPRQGAPKLSIKVKAAHFDTPDNLSDVTWTDTPAGDAPVPVGESTQVWLEDYGTTTNTQRHAADVSIKPGGEPMPCEVDTEANDGMPGISHYGLTKDKTTLEFKTIFSQAEYADFDAQTEKVFRWSRISSAGRTVAIALHRCQIVNTPTPTKLGPSLGMELSFKALRDTTSVASTDAWRTRLAIVLC